MSFDYSAFRQIAINSYMRLSEIQQQITFRSGNVNPVSKKFTQEFLDAGLYVDDDTRAFKKWWLNPEEYFENGGVFSLAYADDKLVGVGSMQIPREGKVFAKDGMQYAFFGKIGFFVNDDYRRNNIANTLAQLLEEAFLKSYTKYGSDEYTPVVFCSRQACAIAQSQFKKIITDKDIRNIFDL